MENSKIYTLPPVGNYYRQALQILSFIPPFSELTSRELDVFALLLVFNEKYSGLEERSKNKLLFDYDTYQSIADSLKKMSKFDVGDSEKISRDSVYNRITALRKKGLVIKGEGSEPDKLNPKFVISRLDVIGFKIIEKDEGTHGITASNSRS